MNTVENQMTSQKVWRLVDRYKMEIILILLIVASSIMSPFTTLIIFSIRNFLLTYSYNLQNRS